MQNRYRVREVNYFEVIDVYECNAIKMCKSRAEAERTIKELTTKYYVSGDTDSTYVKERNQMGDRVVMTFHHAVGVDSLGLANVACEMANLLDKME